MNAEGIEVRNCFWLRTGTPLSGSCISRTSPSICAKKINATIDYYLRSVRIPRRRFSPSRFVAPRHRKRFIFSAREKYMYLVEGVRPVNAWLLLFLLLIARGLHRDRGGPLRRWQERCRYRWRRGLGSWAGDGSTRTPWGSGPIPSLQSPPHAH